MFLRILGKRSLSFLADVGDINRFKKQKKMNAYLGLVPKVKDSGGKSKSGHIKMISNLQYHIYRGETI